MTNSTRAKPWAHLVRVHRSSRARRMPDARTPRRQLLRRGRSPRDRDRLDVVGELLWNHRLVHFSPTLRNVSAASLRASATTRRSQSAWALSERKGHLGLRRSRTCSPPARWRNLRQADFNLRQQGASCATRTLTRPANKTDNPRWWKLSPGGADALRA